METKAYIKNLRISPKKLRFFLKEIKKLGPVKALDYLYYSPKKAAKILYKAIKSAVDNAKTIFGAKEDFLSFKLFTIEQGSVMKRYHPGGRGTIKPYKRRTAHVKIILNIEEKKKTEEKEILPEKVKKPTKKEKVKNGKISVSKK